MSITDSLRLSSGVSVTPVAELPAEVRERLTCGEGDFALTRAQSRTPVRIIDAASADLLREFTRPSTVARAVVRFARGRGASPKFMLEEAYPLLARLFAGGVLVADAPEDGKATHAALGRRRFAGKWEISETLQLLEEAEVYQVRDGTRIAVLKIVGARALQPAAEETTLRHEAVVLEALQGRVAPRLIETGEHEGRFYLVIEWCSGIDAETYAGELRSENDRGGILALCRNVVAAYARLHALGFVHGDIHQRNVLVGITGEVRLIDFGVAAAISEEHEAGNSGKGMSDRTGIAFFYEPEFVAAVLEKRPAPARSTAGEQYAVAVLLYLLATGAQYLNFSLYEEAAFRQIVAEQLEPFASRGVAPWPQLEAILARALSKSPAERYPTIDALAAALAEIDSEGDERTRSTEVSAARSLLDGVVAEISVDGTLEPGDIAPPTASLYFGAGGIAYTLYRLALLSGDAAHLAAADMWLSFAEMAANEPDAFVDPANRGLLEVESTTSPFTTASGLAALRALLSNAQGDIAASREAAARFARLSLEGVEEERRDLVGGRAGVLLAAALLGDALPDDAAERAELARLGGEMLDALWGELDSLPPLVQGNPNLGMAHGWCGYAYAALRFCRTFGRPRPPRLRGRLEELVGLAQPWERGLRWRWNDSGIDAGTMPGWCNGSAGFVPLFTLAHRELGGRRFLDCAIGAAWNAWEAGEGNGSLCCGESGRAYALMTLSRHLGGDAKWLARARALAENAPAAIASSADSPYSLFRGKVGVALLACDLDHPDAAAFPFLEDEGWH